LWYIYRLPAHRQCHQLYVESAATHALPVTSEFRCY
jgi:hypothetical protein